MIFKTRVTGFTLVEMAVVLIIVGLLLGGLLVPLGAQLDQKNNAQARQDLSETKEALVGYAIINGVLPCPDTNGDGLMDACTSTAASASTGGFVPWATLGTKSTDPWGQHYLYRVNNAFSTTFTITTTGSGAGVLRICTDNTCAQTEVNNVPAVAYSSGKNGGVQSPVGADESENTALFADAKFDRTFVDHDFASVSAPNGEFDDIVTWISTNVLINRMVSAGKLP